jgi:heme exporter protein B
MINNNRLGEKLTPKKTCLASIFFSVCNPFIFVDMQHPVWALVRKEFLLEWRQKHSLYGILLYMASTIFVLYIAVSELPSSSVWMALFWILQLFIAVNAVAKGFLQEGRGRMVYYYSICHPAHFILAKLLYHVILMGAMSLMSCWMYSILLGHPLQNTGWFVGVILLGGTGISMTFSLMSAIAAKAQQNAALIAILGFPVIIPLLMLTLRLSQSAMGEIFREGALWQLAGLIGLLDLLVIVLSVILYPFLWRD